MQKITPCLWFDDNAEEAVKFYASIFKGVKIGQTTHYSADVSEVSGRPAGSVMSIEFQLEGQDFLALNGGPIFKFNEAISFQVLCKTQEELDYYWDRLTEGDEKKVQQCGWLKDRFGVSWQIVPAMFSDMAKNPEKFARVMKALLPMKKLDIAALQRAYEE
jgi:predicted 3-demethylubiquinone-9 3-methyltransferase (glyoxalase superfamily)